MFSFLKNNCLVLYFMLLINLKLVLHSILYSYILLTKFARIILFDCCFNFTFNDDSLKSDKFKFIVKVL